MAGGKYSFIYVTLTIVFPSFPGLVGSGRWVVCFSFGCLPV